MDKQFKDSMFLVTTISSFGSTVRQRMVNKLGRPQLHSTRSVGVGMSRNFG